MTRRLSNRAPLRAARAARFALLVSLLVGCGSQLQTGAFGLADLRAQAEAAPRDPALQAKVALGETFSYEGDPARTAAALDRAIALDGDNPRLHLARALLLDVHGRPSEAFDAYAKALALASASSDPLSAALAEISVQGVAGLEGSVPGYADKARAALEPLLDDARVATPARYAAGSSLMQFAYQRGDRDAAQAVAAQLGCVTQMRAIGPFGPRDLLDFDASHAAKPGAKLAASYDLGPRRGTVQTRELGARGCAVHLSGGPLAKGGVSYAQAYIETQSAGEYVARVQVPSTAEVFVDGRSIARLDRRRELLPDVLFVPVELTAGRHEVTIKLATRHPNPVLALAIAPRRAADDGALGLPLTADAPSGFAKYLRGTIALTRGDVMSARESLDGVVPGRPASVLLLLQRATLALLDPLVPSDRRENEAQRLLVAALERDPQAWSPALRLADMMANNGRSKEAIAALRDAMTRWPKVPVIGLSLANLLRKEGWDAEADSVIAKVRRAVPDACAPLSAEIDALRRRSREQDAERVVESLMQCEAQANARFALLLRKRMWDEAERELTRLQSLEPPQNAYPWLLSRIELQKNRGGGAQLEALIAELRARYPRSATAALEHIDRVAGQGDREAALSILQSALSSEPGSMAELHRSVPALGGTHVMAPYRRDGAEAVRRFEASGRSYEGPQVLVFDYMAVRVFEDGSSIDLVHTIQKAQSDEAVDELGEVHVPGGAQILKLHVIKTNGDRLEADRIEGKDGISLPTVTPGDYVEIEYLNFNDPSDAFPTGYAGDRFYFTSFEIPFDHSEMVVVVPKSLAVENDARGAAPTLQEREDGELRVLTYRVEQSEPLKVEPGAVAAREYLPSIRIGANASWGDLVESIEDVLVDRDIHDPEVAALVQRVVGDAPPKDLRLRAQRLYDWVLENIENNDDVFSQAALMLRARTGNRARVLHYMLELAGVPADLALARSAVADSTESDMADTDTYEHLLVTFADERGPVWLFTVERYAPFGYVPPLLLGQPALLLERGGKRVTLPPAHAGQEQRRLVFDIQLEHDGSAHVDAVETVHGTGAVSWRGELESVPKAELEQRFEAEYVARLFPGAKLQSVDIEDKTARAESLAMSYSFEIPTLGRRVHDGWALPSMVPAQLAHNYARLSQRTTTALIASPLELEVVLRIRLPEGASRPALLQPLELEGAVPGRPRFSMNNRLEQGAVVIERKLALPQMRVLPGDYAAFAAFCRKVDAAEAKELVVKLPVSDQR